MNELDRFVKHRLKARYYLRYADDFVVLSPDRQSLESTLPEIQGCLSNRLKLVLHSDKITLRTLASGVDWLGWAHFTDYRVLRTVTKRRMFKRLMNNSIETAKQSYLVC